VICVVDASLALAWCFADEATDVTEAALDLVLQQGGQVPAIWPLEVSNGLIIAHRRARIDWDQVREAIGMLQGLPLRVGPADGRDLWVEAVELARLHQLSAYDAAYLALSIAEERPLATLDRRLARAAAASGVPLLLT
jgi:predicted nucleic acid-binding protein